MTYKMLKDKFQRLEAEGKINDNTVVCNFADEFCHLYEVEDDAAVVVMPGVLAEEKEHMVHYLKDSTWFC